jgi:hypothetical protein
MLSKYRSAISTLAKSPYVEAQGTPRERNMEGMNVSPSPNDDRSDMQI